MAFANGAKDATKPQNIRKNSLSKSLPPGVQKKRGKLGSLKGTKYAGSNRVDVSYLLKGRTSENTNQAYLGHNFFTNKQCTLPYCVKYVIARDVDA